MQRRDPVGPSPDPETCSSPCDNSHNDTQLAEVHSPQPANKLPLDVSTQKKEQKGKHDGHSHSHGHSHGGNCHSDQEMKDAGIASIAWMVIMGDGMHNFSDGLAIGERSESAAQLTNTCEQRRLTSASSSVFHCPKAFLTRRRS